MKLHWFQAPALLTKLVELDDKFRNEHRNGAFVLEIHYRGGTAHVARMLQTPTLMATVSLLATTSS